MKYTLILSTLLFAGCSSEVEGWRINQAYEYCKDKGGIVSIDTTNWKGGKHAVCADGSMINTKIKRGGN